MLGMSKHPTSIRLSQEGKRLLEQIAARLGITRLAVIEILLRKEAKRLKIPDEKDAAE